MTDITPAHDSDSVAFAVVSVEPKEGLEPHGGTVDKLKRTVGELKADYDRIVGQILAMTEHTPAQSNLRLQSVEVDLGFNAHGELGFLAKASAGIDASVKLKFERT
jgi:hypothetical protein